MIWKLSRLFPLLAMTVSSFSGFAQQKPLAAIASPGPGRMPPRQLLMLPSVLPPVPLGRKMPSVNLAQYIQGGVPPYTMSMTQTKPSVAKAFLSGTSLSSDYAYHGGTNVITITVTDSVKSKRTSTLMLTVPVPTVVYPLFGIDFSPYEDGQDPNVGSEISVDQLTRSIGLIALYAKNLRSFGVDHGLENFGCIAHKFGLGAWVNAWIGKDLAANETAVQTLIELAERGCVDVAIIGSEVLLLSLIHI